MIHSIQYLSQKYAEMLEPDDVAGAPVVVISVTKPGDTPAFLHLGFKSVLRLEIPDFAQSPTICDDGMLKVSAATDEVARLLINLQNDTGHHSLVVHCKYGMSRSCAICRFASALTGLAVDHKEHPGAARPGSGTLYELLVASYRRITGLSLAQNGSEHTTFSDHAPAAQVCGRHLAR